MIAEIFIHEHNCRLYMIALCTCISIGMEITCFLLGVISASAAWLLLTPLQPGCQGHKDQLQTLETDVLLSVRSMSKVEGRATLLCCGSWGCHLLCSF